MEPPRGDSLNVQYMSAVEKCQRSQKRFGRNLYPKGKALFKRLVASINAYFIKSVDEIKKALSLLGIKLVNNVLAVNKRWLPGIRR